MPNYKRVPYKLVCRGLSLRYPPDLLPEGYYSKLNNFTARQLGGLQPRSGLTQLFDTGSGLPIHSIRRLNDPTNATFSRLIGAGTSLYDTTLVTPIDTGYSGTPLSMVPFRPNQTPRPWMYISDGQRSRKVRTDRTNYPIGIAPPTAPPVLARGVPQFNIIEQFTSTGSWSHTAGTVPNTAGAITNPARFNTTILAILYDSGSTGWASVAPTAADFNYQPGALIIFNGTEVCKIRQVFEPITSTTIGSILYDTGSTGLCSIVLADQTTGIQPDAMLQIAAAEYIRVLSVATAPDGTVSIRCSTTGTRAAGNAVTGIASFRVYTVGAFTATNTLTGNSFQSTVTTGIGYLSLDKSGAPLNEALAYPNGTGSGTSRPIQPEDYIHISLQVDNPANVVNIRIYLLTDPAFPADFSKILNGYYKDVGPTVFQSVVNSSATAFAAQQTAIQQGVINQTAQTSNVPANRSQTLPADITAGDPTGGLITDPSSTPVQDYTSTGTSAWTELNFHVSELSPIGSSQVVTLAKVTGLIVQVQVTASTVFLVSSWWIGGTYGMDSQGEQPYSLYYRYRSSSTGARSNPSPALRSPIDLQRERLVVTPTVSTDPQVDKINYFTIGGTLTDDAHLSATVPNTATPFNLDVTDAAIKVNEILRFDLFQPFPVTDIPRTGTLNVAGTSVSWVSGDTFNVNWQQGAQVFINGTPYTLYGPPASTTRLELRENGGTQTAATFLIPEATIGGTPLPAMWGPDPLTNVLFAIRSGLDGILRWSNPSDPDSASDANELEITSPSEPLQNGCMFDGRCYVWSTERLFSCYPTTSPDAKGNTVLTYAAQEVPNGKGLFPTYGYASQDSIWAVTKSGIQQLGGGALDSLTDDSLYPLFPHAGQVGSAVNGYNPVDFTQPNSLRVCPTKSRLYFIYQDTHAAYQCMMYDRSLLAPGWFPLHYAPAASFIYEEEGQNLTSVLAGGLDGTVQLLGQGSSDNGGLIFADFTTSSFDLGDPRLQKLFLDYMVDADLQGTSATLTPYVNKLQTALGSSVISGSGRQQYPLDVIQTNLALYLDIALQVQVASTVTPVFYEFEPNAVLQPYLAVNKSSPNYVSHGFTTYGHVRDGYFVYISTSPVNVTILTDLGLTYTIVLPSSGGKITKVYAPTAALKGLLFYYSATSTSAFSMFDDETIIHAKEWGSTGPYLPFKPFAGQSA
jgi:hypothetical protein